MRPRAAFEVMQRLSAIAGIESVEPLSVSQAYLSTPVMVGREREIAALRDRMAAAFGGRGCGVLLEGESGVGRSRLLEACVVEAKMLGATTLRAERERGSDGRGSPSRRRSPSSCSRCSRALRSRARALRGAIEAPVRNDRAAPTPSPARSSGPSQKPTSRGASAEGAVATGCCTSARPTVWRSRSTTRTRSTSLRPRCSRCWRARHEVSACSWQRPPRPARRAAARRPWRCSPSGSAKIALLPLSRAQTEELLGSLFGDVQNLGRSATAFTGSRWAVHACAWTWRST